MRFYQDYPEIIAILLNKLGGNIKISEEEFLEARKREYKIFIEFKDEKYTISLEKKKND